MFGLIVNTQLSNRDTADFKNTVVLFTECLERYFYFLCRVVFPFYCLVIPPPPHFWLHVSVSEISPFKAFASKLLINVK